jgi:hypothetical protein
MGKYTDLASSIIADAQNEEARARGAKLPSPLQGMLSAANSAMLNFGDEVYGGVAGGAEALTTGRPFGEAYRENRDLIRGADEQFRTEHPNVALGTGMAASMPATIYNPLKLSNANVALTGGQKALQLLGNTGRVAGTAAMYGGISGAGRSEKETLGGVVGDAGNAAATSAIMGGLSYPVALGIGGVGRNIYQRTPMGAGSASSFADQKIAEALLRDAQGRAFNASNPDVLTQNAGNMAATRLGKMPQGAPLATAGGRNLQGLTDVVAITEGATKQAVARKQHELIAQEARRMTDSAAKALGTGRPDYNTTIEGFTNAAKLKAAPYYNQLQGVNLQIDDDLRSILARSEPFFAGSNLRSKVDNVGGATLKEALNPASTSVPLARLDVLKQTLYDMEEAGKRSGKLGLSRSIAKLRNELTNKLDDLSPKTQQGDSVYKLARDAYGGDMQLKNAVEQGRLVFREDAMNIRDTLKTMSQSEKDAFRLGVYQAIVDKTGKTSGRTELMNNYRDPAIADRLKAVFGNDYRKFASKLAAEFELKKFQKVGAGSQTAERQSGMGDLNLSPLRDASEGVAALASGNRGAAASKLSNLWQSVSVPESVRADMGKSLLLEGTKAQNKLMTLNDLVQQINAAKQQNAVRYGSTFGQLYGGQQ